MSLFGGVVNQISKAAGQAAGGAVSTATSAARAAGVVAARLPTLAAGNAVMAANFPAQVVGRAIATGAGFLSTPAGMVVPLASAAPPATVGFISATPLPGADQAYWAKALAPQPPGLFQSIGAALASEYPTGAAGSGMPYSGPGGSSSLPNAVAQGDGNLQPTGGQPSSGGVDINTWVGIMEGQGVPEPCIVGAYQRAGGDATLSAAEQSGNTTAFLGAFAQALSQLGIDPNLINSTFQQASGAGGGSGGGLF
jgi:hypothetical protein